MSGRGPTSDISPMSTFIPFDEMVKLDYLYVSAWSLWNDIALILKSIRVLGGHREFA